MSDVQDDKQSKWLSINNLRNVERNYSGWSYTYDFAKQRNLLSSQKSRSYGDTPAVWTPETIEIRNTSEGIEYRIKKISNNYENNKFKTKFGIFYTKNMGEFGGELILPLGDSLYGNFIQVFDFADKVYAIDSLRHMFIGHFKLYEFNDNSHYSCLYEVGDIFGERNDELLDFNGIYITSDNIYILISGEIHSNNATHFKERKYQNISRLLQVTNNKVEEIMEIEDTFSSVQNIIVTDEILYVAADKILAVLNIKNKDVKYYSFIDKKAELNLLKVHNTFD